MAATEHARRVTSSDIIDRLLQALTRTGSDHSSVEISKNAQGRTQFKVSVRTSEDAPTIDEARLEAQRQYDALAAKYDAAEPEGGK